MSHIFCFLNNKAIPNNSYKRFRLELYILQWLKIHWKYFYLFLKSLIKINIFQWFSKFTIFSFWFLGHFFKHIFNELFSVNFIIFLNKLTNQFIEACTWGRFLGKYFSEIHRTEINAQFLWAAIMPCIEWVFAHKTQLLADLIDWKQIIYWCVFINYFKNFSFDKTASFQVNPSEYRINFTRK